MKVLKVADNIWKLKGSSNVYFLDLEKKIIIDSGDRSEHQELLMFLSKLLNLDKVNIVIFTHLHYDHIGNFDIFPNAVFYASQEAIDDFNSNPSGTVLKDDIAEKFRNISLQPAKDMHGLKIIHTPGHSRGSICIWSEKERILFSGDTIFKDCLGRTDLPTSVPDKMHDSVLELLKLNHKILCPGHDY